MLQLSTGKKQEHVGSQETDYRRGVSIKID
uniref:Uncharacterized protein n=1 Tax=Arundo donax TaxID=35708 RepID=A0A0A9DJI3_ARUDO